MAHRNTNPILLTLTLLLGCSPQDSIDASGTSPDGGVDAFASDSGIDAFAPDSGIDAFAPDSGIDAFAPADTFIPDAGNDAPEPPDVGFDAPRDASRDGGFITSIVCPGWPGLPTGGVLLGESRNSPEGVRVGPDCALYVAERETVYRIEQGTGVVTAFATTPMAIDLQGLDFGPDGNLYVASRGANAIVRFDGSTGDFIDLFATSGLDGPNTPRFGPDGRLYVSCRNSNNVVRIEPTGGMPTVFATEPRLRSPEGLSFGPDGDLYVSARLDSVVLRFNGMTGAFMNDVIVFPAVRAPEGIAFASDGSLWIASRDSDEVLRLNITSLAVMNRYPTVAQGSPVGLEVVDDQVVVGLRGTGRVRIFP